MILHDSTKQEHVRIMDQERRNLRAFIFADLNVLPETQNSL